MGYVIFGHGGLNLTSPNMEWVAIPAGTTIQYYADAGQGLLQTSDRIVDVFSQMQQPWPATDSTQVTYNLRLSPFSDAERDQLLASNPDFGGHTLLLVGDTLPESQAVLCNGTPDTCPSDPRQILAGRTHTCTGILATYPGELHWLACTSIGGADAELTGVIETARGDAPAAVLLGEDPDDPVATALAYLSDYPDAFADYFDGLSTSEQENILQDSTIASWHQARAVDAMS